MTRCRAISSDSAKRLILLLSEMYLFFGCICGTPDSTWRVGDDEPSTAAYCFRSVR